MKHLFIISLLFIAVTVQAQETCKVGLDSLKGTYTGDCKGGKANGNGKAVGVDSYEGEFKNGVPEGKGKYTWSSGDFYYGSWKKGQKDGKGELHQFADGKENVVRGYWKKDNYRGEFENPYVIVNTTTDVGRIEVNKVGDNESAISITVQNLRSGSTAASSSFQSSTIMTSNQITRGQYVTKSTNTLTNKEVTVFRGVIFPFRAIFNFGTAIVEMEFFEKGSWDVYIPINK